MPAHVITIARTLCSLGEATARSVAEALEYDYIDTEIIDRAAEITGLDPAELARAEQRKPLLSRLMDTLTPLLRRGEHGVELPGAIVDLADIPTAPARAEAGAYADYESLIRSVIDEFAQRGNVVIVAHGAGMHLSGRDGVLRVLLTASHPVRVRRVQEQGADAGDALRAVDDSDAARREFLQRFNHVERELPTHYDMVVSTDHLTVEAATGAIVAAARD